MLKFYDSAIGKGVASIYESHITFNKELLKYFDEGYRARIGLDIDEKKIYVFIYNKDQALSGEFNESSLLKISTSKTYARISSRSVVNYILDEFKLTIGEAGYLKLDAVYDEVKKAIIVNVGGEFNVPRRD